MCRPEIQWFQHLLCIALMRFDSIFFVVFYQANSRYEEFSFNQIEKRGLLDKGLYRVSGSEKEIKALKERILRGKLVLAPLLSNADVHVICGCIKDFLRGLKEPLIPTALWQKFTNAVQLIDDKAIEMELRAAIEQMPQANRDTLAFLVLHLQRY